MPRYWFRVFDLPEDMTASRLADIIGRDLIPKQIFLASSNDWAWLEFQSNDDMLLAHGRLHDKFYIVFHP